MNGTAVFLGVFYGVITAAVSYVVAMITSGLFVRPFYRLYARVLIGICSIMILAPALRWLAIEQPMLAAAGLMLAQYLTVGILGYGVFRFNREYMKDVFFKRKATAYFTFGTLANAAIVTLVLLQVAVTGAPVEDRPLFGQNYFSAGSYGPLVLLLAAMVFHTDYCLKTSLGDMRRFSRFTFIGYAISFLGIFLSLLPYVGNALAELGLTTTNQQLLMNSSCAQALLIAICLYAWLVWRYESIPPLFLLLFSIVGEYHVLVTQWSIRAFGPASWGLATLPLFIGISAMNQYFTQWDRRKQKSRGDVDVALIPEPSVIDSRFALPFQIVNVGLGVALIGITFWTRFAELQENSQIWLGTTFGVYACYFYALAFIRKNPQLLYVAGALCASAALFGTQIPVNSMSMMLLAILSLTWGILAFAGDLAGLKRQWRTALADCAFLSAILITAVVLGRHVLGPYHFQRVDFFDAAALLLAVSSYVTCTIQYRSMLPMFGGLVAMALICPSLSAGVGLLATTAAVMIEKWVPRENAMALEERLRLFDRYQLPRVEVLPELLVHSLTIGAIPLAVVGLLVSVAHVMLGDFSTTVLLGAFASSLALGLSTRTERIPGIYLLSLGAAYFASHATAQGLVFENWSMAWSFNSHLLLAAAISLVGWLVARTYAFWCRWMLQRVDDENAGSIRQRRSFYSGLLQDLTCLVSVAVLVATVFACIVFWDTPELSLATSSLLTVFFVLLTRAYRSQLGTYLSLIAFSVGVVNAISIAGLSVPSSQVFTGLGVLAAFLSCVFWGWRVTEPPPVPNDETSMVQKMIALAGDRSGVWLRPLSVYACICSLYSVVSELVLTEFDSFEHVISPAAVFVYSTAAVTLIMCTRVLRSSILYLAGISFAFVAGHSAAHLVWIGNGPQDEFLIKHIIVGAALSAAACCIGLIIAFVMNLRLPTSSEDKTAGLIKIRTYYAGILQHFALVVLVLAFIAFIDSVYLAAVDGSPFSHLQIRAGLLLAVVFAISGAVYRSPIQTYLALTATSISTYGLLNHLVDPAFQDAFLAVVAFAFGVISWLMKKTGQEDGEDRIAAWLLPECWEDPPLPQASDSRSLWARPLAQVSIVVPFIAIVETLRNWGHTELLLAIVPFVLGSATWLLATRTYRIGIFFRLCVQKSTGQRLAVADRIERGVLFVFAVLAAAFAIHATADHFFVRGLATPLAVSWHLAVASVLAFGSWVIASAYSIRCRRILDDMSQPEDIRKRVREDVAIYSGLLQLLAVATALAVFAAVFFFGVPPSYSSIPLLCAIVVLVAYFGVDASNYGLSVGTYFCLAALGLATMHVTSLAGADSWNFGAGYALAFALLSLILVIVAGALPRGSATEEESTDSAQALPFVKPLSMRKIDWYGTWMIPLRAVSILYAILGLVLVTIQYWPASQLELAPVESLIACVAAAASFALAARLLQSPAPTYAAVAVLAFGTVPLLSVAGEPLAHGGIALALLAMLVWCAGFAIQKISAISSNVDSRQLLNVYQRPLNRSSAVLATLAIAVSVLAWKIFGWDASQVSLVVACIAGAVTLMLGAHSLKVWHQITRARLLVYLACAAIGGCSIASAAMLESFEALAPAAAISALALASVGLLLIENARMLSATRRKTAASRLLYGEPIAHSALVISVVSVVLTAVTAAGWLVLNWQPQMPVARLADFDFMPAAAALVLVATTCLLSVRSLRDGRWLYGTVIFGSVGLAMLAESQHLWPADLAVLVTLLVMNVLVLLARFTRTHATRVKAVLEVSANQCLRPIYQWPIVVTTALLIGQTTYLGTVIFGVSEADPRWHWPLSSLLMAVLFFQIQYVDRRLAYVHLMIASTVVGCGGLGTRFGWGLSPDVILATLALGWGLLAFQLRRDWGKQLFQRMHLRVSDQQLSQVAIVMAGWSAVLMALSLMVTVPVWIYLSPNFPNTAVTLILITTGLAIGGVLYRNVDAEVAAAILLPASVAAASVFYHGIEQLPYVATFVIIVLAFIYLGLARRFTHREPADPPNEFLSKLGGILSRVSETFSWLAAISCIVILFSASVTILVPLSLSILGAYWLWLAWISNREELVYFALIALTSSPLLTVYGVLELPLEASPPAAFAVVGLGYLLYGINLLVSRANASNLKVFVRPTYVLALTVPIALLAAIPFQHKTVASFAVLAAASFYIIVARKSQTQWVVYVAAVLFNIAIYIWVPLAREQTGLFQLYVIPAAVTVLIFAQLHRNELNHQALTSIRYAASGAILAVSTFEVFFTEKSNLLYFIMVLSLSLIGTAVGVALRIRPFVFIGLAFLVFNVIGQLGVQIHREGGVIRAVIMIAAGLCILGIMVFFNVHRERILRRYRGFMANKQWE